MEHGFKNVHPLYGGFDAWRDAKAPLELKQERREESVRNQ
jgi:3-mercaptopyruvate sulfurtransferase SseA